MESSERAWCGSHMLQLVRLGVSTVTSADLCRNELMPIFVFVPFFPRLFFDFLLKFQISIGQGWGWDGSYGRDGSDGPQPWPIEI